MIRGGRFSPDVTEDARVGTVRKVIRCLGQVLSASVISRVNVTVSIVVNAVSAFWYRPGTDNDHDGAAVRLPGACGRRLASHGVDRRSGRRLLLNRDSEPSTGQA